MIENAGEDFSLTIVDNGSIDGTIEYLQEMEVRYKKVIRRVLFNSTNRGISLPTNVFWKMSKAEFLGKVDNDTLLPPNWLSTLLAAHRRSNKLGVIGGFHFNMNYVDKAALEKRIIDVDGVGLIPDAFIGGCCYLFRKKLQEQFGYLDIVPGRKTFGWTEYQRKICCGGYYNGYLYPLLHVEHFDDPLSEHNLAFTDHVDVSQISFSDKGMAIDRKTMLAWYTRDARRVEAGLSLMQLGLPLRPRLVPPKKR